MQDDKAHLVPWHSQSSLFMHFWAYSRPFNIFQPWSDTLKEIKAYSGIIGVY